MRKLVLAAFAVTAMTVISCRPQGREVPLEESGVTLEGTIYYDDKVVPLAMVIVVPDNGPPGKGGATAFADDEGHYKVSNVSLGGVKVAVNSDAAKGQMMGRAMAGTDPNAKGGKKASVPKVYEVPKKYHDPETSGLKTTTQKGTNSFDIKIPK